MSQNHVSEFSEDCEISLNLGLHSADTENCTQCVHNIVFEYSKLKLDSANFSGLMGDVIL